MYIYIARLLGIYQYILVHVYTSLYKHLHAYVLVHVHCAYKQCHVSPPFTSTCTACLQRGGSSPEECSIWSRSLCGVCREAPSPTHYTTASQSLITCSNFGGAVCVCVCVCVCVHVHSCVLFMYCLYIHVAKYNVYLYNNIIKHVLYNKQYHVHFCIYAQVSTEFT